MAFSSFTETLYKLETAYMKFHEAHKRALQWRGTRRRCV